MKHPVDVMNLFKIYKWRGAIKSSHCKYSIFIFIQVAINKYIQYSFPVRYLLGTRLYIKEQIYLIFGKLSGYEYIQYSYFVKFSFTNMFVFSQEFDILVTLHYQKQTQRVRKLAIFVIYYINTYILCPINTDPQQNR